MNFNSKNEPLIRGKKRLNLTVDPPPDLVIEVDITHFSFDKLELYAEYNVPEVWHYNGNKVVILQLIDGNYSESNHSSHLPILTSEALSVFMLKSESVDRYEWLEEVQTWAKEKLKCILWKVFHSMSSTTSSCAVRTSVLTVQSYLIAFSK